VHFFVEIQKTLDMLSAHSTDGKLTTDCFVAVYPSSRFASSLGNHT